MKLQVTLTLSAALVACALAGQANAAVYTKYEGIKGAAIQSPQPQPQAAGRAKADILIESMRASQAGTARTAPSSPRPGSAPDIITGAGAGGGPNALLVPAIQKMRAAGQ